MNSIVLVGTPDTGKTNFLGRLWEALRSRKGRLICPRPPEEIKYVEDALGHILNGKFAPRSNQNIGESRSDVTIPVSIAGGESGIVTDLLIPDVTGELWRSAVENLEIPAQWMEDLKAASGAMLFVRVLSDEIVSPLDWVNARGVLRHNADIPEDQQGIPTQVQLCELLRFLEFTLGSHEDETRPRVAIVVTAFDLLDKQTIRRGPMEYIRREYPLFWGRLHSESRLDLQIFGVSVVSGDLDRDEKFRNSFLEGELADFGYVVFENEGQVVKKSDISIPVAWLVEGK